MNGDSVILHSPIHCLDVQQQGSSCVVSLNMRSIHEIDELETKRLTMIISSSVGKLRILCFYNYHSQFIETPRLKFYHVDVDHVVVVVAAVLLLLLQISPRNKWPTLPNHIPRPSVPDISVDTDST